MDRKEIITLFAQNLRAERARKNYSQEKLAELAEISPEYLARIEKEKNIKIVFQPPKPKKVEPIDLAAIATMEDDEDGAMPQNERNCLFEKTDYKNELLRRVRRLWARKKNLLIY